MLVSRGLGLCRRTLSLVKPSVRSIMTSAPRRGGASSTWQYRDTPLDPPKNLVYSAEAVSALMWWWVLWHLWHEPEHIYGEFPYPYPSQWTDEELGIPPDDE